MAAESTTTLTTDQLKDLLALMNGGSCVAADRIRSYAPTLAAEVVRLRGEVDMWRAELKALLDAYEKPDDRMCCDGRMCGCMGATNHQYAEYMARQALDAASEK